MKNTTELLRELRVDRDLTQAEVADVLGISQQHYSLYENGVYELPMRHFAALAEYYQVSADYLLGREVLDEKNPANMVYITKDYTAAKLINSVSGLCDTAKEALVLYLEFLVHLQEKHREK